MTINDYQQSKAKRTIQTYRSIDKDHYYLGYLGLAGEAGTVLTTLKKLLRDGEGFGSFNDKLKEELGDVLWYVSSIASHYNLSLEEIAQINLSKIHDRFEDVNLLDIPRFDKNY